MIKLKGIYLIEFENGGVKFGMSTNIRDRIQTYKQPWCLPIKKAVCLECQYPRMVEEKIKDYYKTYILKPSYEFIKGVDIELIKEFVADNRFARKDNMLIDTYYSKVTGWHDLLVTPSSNNVVSIDAELRKKASDDMFRRIRKAHKVRQYKNNYYCWGEGKIKCKTSRLNKIASANDEDWD